MSFSCSFAVSKMFLSEPGFVGLRDCRDYECRGTLQGALTFGMRHAGRHSGLPLQNNC